MLARAHDKFSPAEYLARERVAATKSEYDSGEIFARAGGSREHNLVSANLIRLLGNQVLQSDCAVYSSDMKIKIEKIAKYCYPDVTLSCAPELFEDDKKDVLLNPRIIIEVLSDSTEAYDRGKKFADYQWLESLQEYILVGQKAPKIEIFSRQKHNRWLYSTAQNLQESIYISSIGYELSLHEVYRKVQWQETL